LFTKKITGCGNFARLVFAGAALTVMLAGSASAHLPVAAPDKFTVPAGGSVNIEAGLAEPLIEFEYSPENILAAGYAGKFAAIAGEVRYADGAASAISFAPSNPAKPDESKFSKAAVSIEKPGTAVITMKFDFNSGNRPTVAYGKTLVNWTKDGSAAKFIGGDGVLEISQAEDTGPLSSGGEVAVRVSLRGKALANAVASATYKGAPLPDPGKAEEGEERNNEYLHKETDTSGRVAFTLDRPGTWVVAMEYVDEGAPKNKQEYEAEYTEWKGVRYRASLVFDVAK